MFTVGHFTALLYRHNGGGIAPGITSLLVTGSVCACLCLCVYECVWHQGPQYPSLSFVVVSRYCQRRLRGDEGTGWGVILKLNARSV